MAECVPTTWDEIATGFGEYAEQLCRGGKWREEGYSADFEQHSGYLAAQAWLAAHDATVRADAWDEGWGAYSEAHLCVDGCTEPTHNPYRIREGGEHG